MTLPRALPRLSIRQILCGLPFVALFILLFWPTFTWLAERFDTHDSFYSHGWLVPFASGWLIWLRRAQLQACRVRSSFWGLSLLIPALLLHLPAIWWRLHFVSGFAMLATLYGLVWTIWGWNVLWTVRFAMLFLLFMIPLPGVLLIAISFKMKLMAATLATHVIRFIGIPARQAGSMIQVPGVSVIVDDTCSGLRSLISLIALSTFWIALMPATAKHWKKITMVAASIPVALAANMVRIIILVLLSAIYGPRIAESFIHYGSGIVLFGVALAVLAWLSHALVGPAEATAQGATP